MSDWCKRMLDVSFAAGGVVATAPLWVAIALVIKLTSPGPVLYAGSRVGKAGSAFRMFKFRTMCIGPDTTGPSVTAADDPRITPIGRLLRDTKLDELPQLLNVLRGEMSFVGPRPEAPEYVACYGRHFQPVLSVRPGITGPTQLTYIREENLLRHANADAVYRQTILPRKLESDLRYIETQSLLGDLRLIAATAAQIVRRGETERRF